LPLISSGEPFLLLDRDGTLVDIAENPFDAVIPSSTLDLLSDLASNL
jgi:trehalose-6-phosphatase